MADGRSGAFLGCLRGDHGRSFDGVDDVICGDEKRIAFEDDRFDL